MRRYIFTLLTTLAALAATASKPERFTLSDPEGVNTVTISVGQDITYTVEHRGRRVMGPQRIALELGDGSVVLGRDARVTAKEHRTASETIKSQVYKRSEVKADYGELTLRCKAPAGCKGTYSIVWRAYPDGVAYRIVTDLAENYTVRSELAEFIPSDPEAQMVVAPIKGRTILGEENQWHSNFQNTYKHSTISQWPEDRQIMLPALIQEGGVSLCITEVDLFNYPGMRLQTADGKLRGVFAAYPKETKVTTRGLKKEVHAREDYIARVAGKTELPWRAIQIVDDEKELLASDFVMKLA
ncbi:MAG: glycoside hydrolase family 97 N-terminal domain-containing protein, partial [Bacteroidaceae bacterium]|nr:glycoside hydrolase family 97 N-terminal domain-containing protein [Bacteroidaceae bacterium]